MIPPYILLRQQIENEIGNLSDVWTAVKQDLDRFLGFLDAVAQAEVGDG